MRAEYGNAARDAEPGVQRSARDVLPVRNGEGNADAALVPAQRRDFSQARLNLPPGNGIDGRFTHGHGQAGQGDAPHAGAAPQQQEGKAGHKNFSAAGRGVRRGEQFRFRLDAGAMRGVRVVPTVLDHCRCRPAVAQRYGGKGNIQPSGGSGRLAGRFRKGRKRAVHGGRKLQSEQTSESGHGRRRRRTAGGEAFPQAHAAPSCRSGSRRSMERR